MKEELIGKVVQRLTALADESRLRLLMRLRTGPCNVTTLSQELELGQASVSKHLAVLRRAGLVDVEHRGTSAIYRCSDPAVFDICRHLCDGVLRHVKREHAALGLSRAPTRKRRRAASARN